jgi:hypothetical protein
VEEHLSSSKLKEKVSTARESPRTAYLPKPFRKREVPVCANIRNGIVPAWSQQFYQWIVIASDRIYHIPAESLLSG